MATTISIQKAGWRMTPSKPASEGDQRADAGFGRDGGLNERGCTSFTTARAARLPGSVASTHNRIQNRPNDADEVEGPSPTHEDGNRSNDQRGNQRADGRPAIEDSAGQAAVFAAGDNWR